MLYLLYINKDIIILVRYTIIVLDKQASISSQIKYMTLFSIYEIIKKINKIKIIQTYNLGFLLDILFIFELIFVHTVNHHIYLIDFPLKLIPVYKV